ncbi:TIGR03032 family protein [Cognatishimia sp. F0-27]|uniref:TIGR03032 family protein n=1 Tax=Cognatishimia sp. F0-27 TaxID=2816855 RepID=UPI001D0CB29A|nr:TIGR03032 family protein [Cognatishimia sp. F0-27]MCC1494327.1 TIGR03032 family protein [Cognatishimia sp. F0-27]
MTEKPRDAMRDNGAQSHEASGNRLDISASRQFTSFLTDHKAALAMTTYQAGMVLFIGTNPETGKLWIFNRHLERPMGIASDRRRLAVAGLTSITTFIDGHSGTATEGQDPVYVPQIAHFTGDLDTHDVAFDESGDLVFVNTLFSCLATTSETHSFRPLWKPRFISRLAAEDRCHLNGLAMRDGKPAFVSAVSATDVADGWRDHRREGGVIIDVATSEIVGTDLSMPHSPRWHQGKLWLLNAGSGEFGTLDPESGTFTPVAFCPGYLRGLNFIGRYAIVGASEPRENKTFSGLALQERLNREKVSARCGLFIIDTETGDVVHWLRIEGIVKELFDIAIIPEARMPQMIGFRSDEIRRVISVENG